MTLTRIELPDTRGLITGFVFRPEASPVPVGWAEISALPESCQGGVVWLHFNLTDARARDWISHGGMLSDEAAEFLLSAETRIRLDRLGDGIAGVLADLHHDFDLDPESVGVIRFYAEAQLLVSGRRHPLRAVDRLRREIMSGTAVTSPMSMLAHLLDHLAETFESLVGEMGEQVDGIEDRILMGHYQKEGAGLGRLRRLMSRLRRHLNAERHELAKLRAYLPPWCSESDREELRTVLDRLDSLGQDLELFYERGRLLQDEIGSRLSEATNRNLYVLSIVTTIFLPMTLITGLFGINVGGMPWLESPSGFWLVVIGMLATAVVTFLVLHWRRLF